MRRACCGPIAGQTAAASDTFEHHISSMTFLFGQR
jgi:hypothetical protein